MSDFTKERALLGRHLCELAERSYSKGIYTFTGFLSLDEQSVLLGLTGELGYASPSLFGGTSFAERRCARFGSEEALGYDEPFPISVIEIKPSAGAFARELSHRDFLGSVLNLGIERSVVGDILINRDENTGYIFCIEQMASFIAENLIKVRNERVECTITDIYSLPKGIEPRTELRTLSVASPRLDGIVAAVWHLSRSDAQELIRSGLVFVNHRELQSTSENLSEGDLVSVRGKGRFIYRGINYVSRKGRDNISVEMFI